MFARNKVIIIAIILFLSALIIAVYMQQQDKNTQSGDCIVSAGIRSCTEEYEDMNMDDAIEKARSNNLTAKIRELDGDRNVANTDLGGTPIFFTVNNDIVTKAEFN